MKGTAADIVELDLIEHDGQALSIMTVEHRLGQVRLDGLTRSGMPRSLWLPAATPIVIHRVFS